jgi:hypothetical protein
MRTNLKFKIGDTVEVIDAGYVYSSYYDMVEYMKLKNWQSGLSIYNNTFPDSAFEIIALAIHGEPKKGREVVKPSYYNYWVAGIEDLKSGKQYVIGVKGLRKIFVPIDFISEKEMEV